ncbi:unnamed protein product [Gordionus sp. m RMFG-2023]
MQVSKETCITPHRFDLESTSMDEDNYPFITGGSRYSQTDMEYYFPEEFPVSPFLVSPDIIMPKKKEKHSESLNPEEFPARAFSVSPDVITPKKTEKHGKKDIK